MLTKCMFCDAPVSVASRLLHGRYCSTAHHEAYLESLDRLGLQRLREARPSACKVYEPCTKRLELVPAGETSVPIAAECKGPNLSKVIHTHLDLVRGEAGA